MLHYFEVKKSCQIEFYPPIVQEDVENLDKIFDQGYYDYKVTFGQIYTIPSSLTLLLYDQIVKKNKKITLSTHKSKLNKYFHRLGFHSSFISQIQKEITKLKSAKSYVSELEKLDSLYDNKEKIIYLLNEIEKRFNYNFNLYKKDMIKRRLTIFMIKHDIKCMNDAVTLILLSKVGFRAFFLELSINVTEFFRNPDSYKVLERLLQHEYKNTKRLKIWSAGCSNGKEAYSIAMVLDNYQKLQKSLIYATDFNKIILEDAKAGLYSNDAYEVACKNAKKGGFEHYIDNYIVKNDYFIQINEELMKNLLFLEHNLTKDSSFNEFNIIMCKNVLIYFDDNLQKKVFALLYDSLRFGGYLFLGESEIVHSSFKEKFVEYDIKNKIYKKVA